VLSPTRLTYRKQYHSTALVGVFTNKTHIQKTISQAQPLLVLSPTRVTYRKQNHKHSPCWCFHQQDSYAENSITSTALVGVITNKSHIHKTISQAQPLLVFSPTRFTCRKQYHKYSPCWCYHQQDSYAENNITNTALVGVFTNKNHIQKTISQAQPLLVLSPTRFNAENRMARFQDEINDKQTQPLLVLSPTRVCGIARNVLAF
jgi:hypothetical protein